MKIPVSDAANENMDQTLLISTLAELGKRIRRQRQEMDMTLDDLAAATGISKPYLSNIETARLVGPPSSDKLAQIEKALAIPSGELIRRADWLRTPESIRLLMPETAASALPRHNSGAVDLDELLRGRGSARPTEKPGASAVNIPTTAEHRYPPLVHIPLINRVAAGSPTEFTDLDYPVGIADAYIPAPMPDAQPDQPEASPKPEAGMFALRVEGDSMSPQYLPGDIIVLSSIDTPTDGDDCLIRLDEQGNFATTFKRIYFVDAQGNPASYASHVQLCPLNSRHATRIVARENITSLYPAVWKITPTPRRTPADHTTASVSQTTPVKAPSGKRKNRREASVRDDSPNVNALAPAPAAETIPLRSALSDIQSATQGFQIDSD
jgi:repressor LexA